MEKRTLVVFQKKDLGNVIFASPFLKSLNDNVRHPLDVVTTSGAASILRYYSFVGEIFISERGVDPDGILTTIRRNRYELVFVLSDYPESITIGKKSGAFSVGPSQTLDKCIVFDEGAYRAEKYLAMLSIMEFEVTTQTPFFHPETREIEKVDELCHSCFVPDIPLIGIHVGASHPCRRIPLQKLQGLMRMVREKHQVVIFFGPAEAGYFHSLKEVGASAFGDFTVGELAYALAKCDYCFASDSGPAHLCYAMGTPSLVFHQQCMNGCGKWRPNSELALSYYPEHICIDNNSLVDRRRDCEIQRTLPCFWNIDVNDVYRSFSKHFGTVHKRARRT